MIVQVVVCGMPLLKLSSVERSPTLPPIQDLAWAARIEALGIIEFRELFGTSANG